MKLKLTLTREAQRKTLCLTVGNVGRPKFKLGGSFKMNLEFALKREEQFLSKYFVKAQSVTVGDV